MSCPNRNTTKEGTHWRLVRTGSQTSGNENDVVCQLLSTQRCPHWLFAVQNVGVLTRQITEQTMLSQCTFVRCCPALAPLSPIPLPAPRSLFSPSSCHPDQDWPLLSTVRGLLGLWEESLWWSEATHLIIVPLYLEFTVLGRVMVPKAQSPERHINEGLVQTLCLRKFPDGDSK